MGQVRPKPSRQRQWRDLALRHFALLEEKGSYLRLPRVYGDQKECHLQLHPRIYRCPAGDEIRILPAGWHWKGRGMGRTGMGRRRGEKISGCLLPKPDIAGTGVVSAYSGSSRVLA